MDNKVFKSKLSDYEKYITRIQPKRDFFHSSRKNLIKSYVLDPDVKIIK